MLIFARYHPYTYEQFLDYGKGLYAVRELSFTCLFFFFFFANPKSEVADLCKSTLVNACQIVRMNEGYLLFNTITHLSSPVILQYIKIF